MNIRKEVDFSTEEVRQVLEKEFKLKISRLRLEGFKIVAELEEESNRSVKGRICSLYPGCGGTILEPCTFPRKKCNIERVRNEDCDKTVKEIRDSLREIK